MFSEQLIQQVQQATDIIDLIGQYVALTRKGKEFLGLCPFHADKRPSMNVSPTKQIFKCFSCGAGGDVFKFLSLYEKCSFPEAVELLADKANIPLPKDGAPANNAEPGLSKNDLIRVMTAASEFFCKQLFSPAGKHALAYARDRGFTDESLERFRIGYAPDEWNAFQDVGRGKGFSEAQMLTAGMLSRSEKSGKCYDRFRNRLIFPILDPANNVIAFGGRALSPEERAKYLNSPESPLFDKSSQLYALNWAREQIVSTGTAVIVEGYLDALIPIQAGVGNVVASLGTALTDRHVRLLSRYAKEAVLVFDADQAGAAAAQRALEIFLAQQIHVRVATIPEGKDPCDFCLSAGPEALQTLIDEAPDALHYVWDNKLAQYKAAGDNLAVRKQVVDEFLTLVASSSAYGAIDEIRRGQLAQHIGHMLNIPATQLQQQMRHLSRRVRTQNTPQAPTQQSLNTMHGLSRNPERIVLEVLLNEPDLFGSVSDSISPEDFAAPQAQAIARRVWALGEDGRLAFDNIQGCAEMADHSELLADLALAGERRGEYSQALAKAVEHILYRRNQEELQNSNSAGGLDDDALRRLMQHAKTPDVRRRGLADMS